MKITKLNNNKLQKGTFVEVTHLVHNGEEYKEIKSQGLIIGTKMRMYNAVTRDVRTGSSRFDNEEKFERCIILRDFKRDHIQISLDVIKKIEVY